MALNISKISYWLNVASQNLCLTQHIRDDPVDVPTGGATTGFPPLVPEKEPDTGLGVMIGLTVDWPGPGVGIGVGISPLQSGTKQQESDGSDLSGQLEAG